MSQKLKSTGDGEVDEKTHGVITQSGETYEFVKHLLPFHLSGTSVLLIPKHA